MRLTPGQAAASDACSRFFLTFLTALFLIAVPLGLCWAEYEQLEMHEAFEEAKEAAISVVPEAPVSHMNIGSLVHVSTNQIRTDEALVDEDFALEAPGNALKLQRRSEYCQWMEHVSERKNRDGEVERSYWYTKSWRPYPVPSLFFDQPFRHNNPQRTPFANGVLQVSEANLGSYTVGPRLIDSLPASEPLRLEHSPDALSLAHQSLASSAHNYHYVGDGFFYSPFEESNASWFARLAGQALEGSLLDIQITDLFDQCTPGDVRTRFTVAAPSSASALGRQLDADGHIGAWTSSRDYEVGLLQEGLLTPEEMLEAVKSEHRWVVLLARVATIAWMYVLLGHVGLEEHNVVRFGTAVAGTAGALGAIWALTWGPSLLAAAMASMLVVTALLIRMETAQPPAFDAPYVASTSKSD